MVFSIVIVALTLTSTQFGPRMLRNFIRDPGTQVTLGTFVGTFVYAILTLGSIGQERHGNFVPHISITVTLALLVVGLGGLIYFIHHIATQIQLPQVIAGIARDPARTIDTEAGNTAASASAPSATEALAAMPGSGGTVGAPRSGYLQFIDRHTLIAIASRAGVTIHLLHRPGHFLVQGHPYATVWPAERADVVARAMARAQVTGNWQPTHVYCDASGTVLVITTEPTYERLVRRSFEKIRQASRGMPAIMIRQLDALAKIMQRTESAQDKEMLLEQAAMIDRLAASSVDEAADRADVQRAYRSVADVNYAVRLYVDDK